MGVPRLDDASVRSGSEISWPEWFTLREARFLTGQDDEALLDLVRAGAVGTDRALEGLGSAMLLLRVGDLRRAGLLDGMASPEQDPIDEGPVEAAPVEAGDGDEATELLAEFADLTEPHQAEEVQVEFVDRPDAAEPTVEELALHGDWRSFFVVKLPTDGPDEVGAPEARRRTAMARAVPLRKAARPVLRAGAWAALGWVAALLLVVAVPMLAGYRPVVVDSGAMIPTLSSGDVVMDRPITASQARVGDLVAFRDPADASGTLLRRVREAHPDGSAVRFVTKGDANRGVERWTIGADQRIGLVAYRVPWLGTLVSAARSGWGIALLIGAAGATFALRKFGRAAST
jgi:signal peptidase